MTAGRVRVSIRAMGKLEPNLHVDADLLARAEAVGISPEFIAEQAIRREMVRRTTPEQQEARAKQWAKENAEAIKAHREQIEKYGVFGDDLRTWRVRQFDVFPNPSEGSRRIAPFVVVLQSHLLDDLPTVIVAPLLRPAERPAFTDVGMHVSFSGEGYTLSVAELSATDARRLSRPVGSLRDYDYEIRRALDRVFTGF